MNKILPHWFKQEIPDMQKLRELKELFHSSHLNTVCQEAQCPNLGKCWQEKTATFMILGNVCTRNCRFCAVQSGVPSEVNSDEPLKVAQAVKQLGLKYVVITSVTRDDLLDEGAEQFVQTIQAIRDVSPDTKVEILIPDLSFVNKNLAKVVNASPDVIGHNIETVRSVFQQVRSGADYEKSLSVLRHIKQIDPLMIVKSGFMVGLGETFDEVIELMKDLYQTGCDILSIGQYLCPHPEKNVGESRFVLLEEFETYRMQGKVIGFPYIISGPLVRSSFLAEEGYAVISKSRKEENFEEEIDNFFPFNI